MQVLNMPSAAAKIRIALLEKSNSLGKSDRIPMLAEYTLSRKATDVVDATVQVEKLPTLSTQ